MQSPKNVFKSNSQVLNESVASFNKHKTYDIFLSHSSKDAELILGIKGIFEDLGYVVYVDWVDDPQLDRTNVSKNTAEKLRERMNASKSLFYVTTDNADSSKWMPWECGYFDGLKEKVAIVPIQKNSLSNEFLGQEYLGLYPYCIQEQSTLTKQRLWIFKDSQTYMLYEHWLASKSQELFWRKVG